MASRPARELASVAAPITTSMPAAMTAATTNASKKRCRGAPAWRARPISSSSVIALASDVSFCMAMNWLPISGVMIRSAWGSTIRRMVCQGVMPSAAAASVWPRPTA